MVKDKKFYLHLFMLTVPIILQSVITYSVSLTDNIMIGSLGETATSGVYVVNQVTTFLQRLVMGLSSAMIILAAQYWGKDDVKSVKTIVSIGLKISFFSSAVVAVLLFSFPRQVLALFTDKPTVIEAGIIYGKFIACTYVIYCITNILISAMRCVETVKIGMIVSIAALVVNVFLNWVLIFGNLGFPALGAKGAGIATLAARVVEFIIIFIYVAFIDKKLNFKLKDLFNTNKLLLMDFVKYGIPITAGSVSWGINLAVQGAIIGRFDEPVIAAFSISNIVFQIITVGAYSSATASSIIIGKAVGSGDIDRVKSYARTLQVIFIGIGIITGIVMFTSRGLIPFIYKDMSAETLAYASQFIIVLAVMSVGTSYQMATLTGIVRAGGATNFVLINDLLFVWLIVLPSSALAAFVIGTAPWIVVLCLKCDQILKCIVAVVKVNRFKWIKNLTREIT